MQVNRAQSGDLLRRGLLLEYVTLAWNVVGTVVIVAAAIKARSVALAGFGLHSLIENFCLDDCDLAVEGNARTARTNGVAVHRRGVRRTGRLCIGTIGLHSGNQRAACAFDQRNDLAGADCHRNASARGWQTHHRTAAWESVLMTETARVTLVDAYLAAAVLVLSRSQQRARLVVGRSGGGSGDRLLRLLRGA